MNYINSYSKNLTDFFRTMQSEKHLITKSTNIHVYCRFFYIAKYLNGNWVTDIFQFDNI